MQTLACCSDDRKCPELASSPTDVGTVATQLLPAFGSCLQFGCIRLLKEMTALAPTMKSHQQALSFRDRPRDTSGNRHWGCQVEILPALQHQYAERTQSNDDKRQTNSTALINKLEQLSTANRMKPARPYRLTHFQGSKRQKN